MSLEVDYTRGTAWPLMRFIYIPCTLVFHKFSFTAQSVDLTSVEYCRVKYFLINIFAGHMVSCYFLISVSGCLGS